MIKNNVNIDMFLTTCRLMDEQTIVSQTKPYAFYSLFAATVVKSGYVINDTDGQPIFLEHFENVLSRKIVNGQKIFPK